MRVSFDIDGTLVCHGSGGPVDEWLLPGFVHRLVGDSLRYGARALIAELRRRGCSVWIYTTSARTVMRVRLWLLLYGVRVDGVVNSDRHRREVARRELPRLPSKYPPAFGIDLHIDDSEGTRMEGEKFGFRVLVVRPDDEEWTKKVLSAIEQIQCG